MVFFVRKRYEFWADWCRWDLIHGCIYVKGLVTTEFRNKKNNYLFDILRILKRVFTKKIIVYCKCVICKCLRSPPQKQKMSDLPTDRLQEEPPFTYSGVDLFDHSTLKKDDQY